MSMNYPQNYTNFNRRQYNPKAAVKQFTDLEVYQKSLEGSVFAAHEVINFLRASKAQAASARTGKGKTAAMKAVLGENKADAYADVIEESIIKSMSITALSIPHLIAESHSKRFGESTECLKILDEVMLKCNKMAVYLEQIRDICQTGIEANLFEEEINKYFYIRRKVLNLQRVWRKYITENTRT